MSRHTLHHRADGFLHPHTHNYAPSHMVFICTASCHLWKVCPDYKPLSVGHQSKKHMHAQQCAPRPPDRSLPHPYICSRKARRRLHQCHKMTGQLAASRTSPPFAHSNLGSAP